MLFVANSELCQSNAYHVGDWFCQNCDDDEEEDEEDEDESDREYAYGDELGDVEDEEEEEEEEEELEFISPTSSPGGAFSPLPSAAPSRAKTTGRSWTGAGKTKNDWAGSSKTGNGDGSGRGMIGSSKTGNGVGSGGGAISSSCKNFVHNGKCCKRAGAGSGAGTGAGAGAGAGAAAGVGAGAGAGAGAGVGVDIATRLPACPYGSMCYRTANVLHCAQFDHPQKNRGLSSFGVVSNSRGSSGGNGGAGASAGGRSNTKVKRTPTVGSGSSSTNVRRAAKVALSGLGARRRGGKGGADDDGWGAVRDLF
jgi:hypothetical protein